MYDLDMTQTTNTNTSKTKMPYARLYQTALILYMVGTALFLGGIFRAFVDGNFLLFLTFVGLAISCLSFALAVGGIYQTHKQAYEESQKTRWTPEEMDLLERLARHLEER